jgi:ribosomal-protein-alanine N-acetyltransferase
MLEVKTERLLLLPWSDQYVDDLVRIFGKPEVIRHVSGSRPIKRDKCLEISCKWIGQWDKYGYGPWAAIEKTSGRWIGEIGLEFLDDWPLRDKWEVGWILDPAFWGRGLATEGGKAGIRFGFDQAELKRIISPTVPENEASRRVMEKCGLTCQGLIHWRKTECVWYAIDGPAACEDRP